MELPSGKSEGMGVELLSIRLEGERACDREEEDDVEVAGVGVGGGACEEAVAPDKPAGSSLGR